MSKTIEQLAILAAQIEEATRQGENTALRVGGLFSDIVDYLATLHLNDITLGPLLTSLNNSGLLEPSDGQTLAFSIMDDKWKYSDAITQLKLSIRGIEQTVASNYRAFLQVKDELEAQVNATDQRVREYKTEYDQSQIEYATWKSQTDTSISQYATAFTVDGRMVSMSEMVQTAYDIEQSVTNNKEFADAAFEKLFDIAGMELSDEPSASWLYQNRESITAAAYTFNPDGSIKQGSRLDVTIDGIDAKAESADGKVTELKITVDGLETDVRDVKGNMSHITQTVNQIDLLVKSYDGRISEISQTADTINARVTDLSGKYSDLKLDVNSISATVNDPDTGIGALNVKANDVKAEVRTLDGKVADLGVRAVKKDANNYITEAYMNADLINFKFLERWSVRNANDVEVMWLEPDGNLTVTGTINADLNYYSMKYIEGSYTINPEVDLCSVYCLHGGAITNTQEIFLPSPSAYKGLELTFFCEYKAHSRSWTPPVLKGPIYDPTEEDYGNIVYSLTMNETVYKFIGAGGAWARV